MSKGVELPNSWIRTTLESVAEIHDELRRPVNASERELRSGTIPYYGATGQVGWIDDYLLDGEYVLLGEDGAPFLDATKPKAYIISGKSWVNNHAHVLQAIDGVSTNRFLLYALNATDYHEAVNGTTRLKLTQAAMRELTLSLPPLNEQRRIVAVIEEQFTRLDAGVAALKRAQAALKRYRAAVLKAAVEGRLTAAWRAAHPDVEPASALLGHILTERWAKWEADLRAKGKDPAKARYEEPKPPQTEGLPELPEGWVWATVDQVSQFTRYGTSAKTNDEQDGVPILRMGNIQDGTLDFTRLKHLPTTHAEFPELLLQPGDLLFNRTNSAELVGKSAVYHGIPAPCSFASYLIGVRFLPGCSSDYAGFALNSTLGREWVASVVVQQVGQANVNGSKLRAFHLPLPPRAEQDALVATVEERISVITTLEATIAANLKRAERLRQAILERAFTGRLVPQDPGDEPAGALLERVRRERVDDGMRRHNVTADEQATLWTSPGS